MARARRRPRRQGPRGDTGVGALKMAKPHIKPGTAPGPQPRPLESCYTSGPSQFTTQAPLTHAHPPPACPRKTWEHAHFHTLTRLHSPHTSTYQHGNIRGRTVLAGVGAVTGPDLVGCGGGGAITAGAALVVRILAVKLLHLQAPLEQVLKVLLRHHLEIPAENQDLLCRRG